MTKITHQARVVMTRALNERVVFDVKIRKIGARDELDSIAVRVTLSESGMVQDIGHPNCWSYDIRDHRYVLAKVRDALAVAVAGPWLDVELKTAEILTIEDLRGE